MRRVFRLERDLRPDELVRAWLVTAQAHGSIHAYVRHAASLPGSADPILVMMEGLEEATRRRHRGEMEWRIERFVRTAIGDAAFLHQLVLVLNEATYQALDVQRRAIPVVEERLFALLDQRLSRHRGEPLVDEAWGSSWRTWRSAADQIVDDVAVEARARQAFERHHYGGHSVLFPDLAAEWSELTVRVQELAQFAAYRPPRQSGRRRRDARRHAREAPTLELDARIAGRIARLVDEARFGALRRLGRDEAAGRVMVRLLEA